MSSALNANPITPLDAAVASLAAKCTSPLTPLDKTAAGLGDYVSVTLDRYWEAARSFHDLAVFDLTIDEIDDVWRRGGE